MKCFPTILPRWCKQTKNRKPKESFLRTSEPTNERGKNCTKGKKGVFLIRTFYIAFIFIVYFIHIFIVLTLSHSCPCHVNAGICQSSREIFYTLMLFSGDIIMKTNDEKSLALSLNFNNKNDIVQVKSLCPNQTTATTKMCLCQFFLH